MASNENLTELTELIIERLKDGSTGPLLPKGSGNNHSSIFMKSVHKNQKAILCCQCRNHIHIKCNDISPTAYEFLRVTTNWTCIFCTIQKHSQIFPFTLETDDVLLGTNVTDLPSKVDLLPSLQILSKLQNLPNLSDYDIDEIIEPDINCNYYNVQEFQSIETSAKDISLFHMNIRSLHLHFDELFTLLTTTGADFEIIGLSETKETVESSLAKNTDIPGYKFYNTPSQSAAGGVGIYVKSNLKVAKRIDLSISTLNFETVWIEIQNTKSKNVLCCCAYRHPSSEINTSNDHMQEIMTRTENENKLVFIMGDFNLLNYENHTPTSNFLNTFFTNHLQPLILQPTRVTDSISTLIDNIFSNDITSKVISGNILIHISDHFLSFLFSKTRLLTTPIIIILFMIIKTSINPSFFMSIRIWILVF